MTPALFFAFTAGAVATVNPCGWALLPAWFARRLSGSRGTRQAFAALRAGVMATAGFIVIFGVAGVALALGAAWLGPLLPVVGLGVGVTLALIGVASLLDLRWSALPGGEMCRTVSDRHGSLFFGIGYGLLSLSCTLPIFLSALGFSLTGTPLDLALNMLAYALGMGTVLSSLGIVAATAGAGFGQLTPQGAVIVRKIGAVLLLAAAAYVIIYWGRVVFGDVMVESRIVNVGERASGFLRRWLTGDTGRVATGLSLALLLAMGAYGLSRRRRRRIQPHSAVEHRGGPQ